MANVDLGRTYKDKVTGFEGVAMAHIRYLTGCDQVCVQPPAKDGAFVEARYFDLPRLEEVAGVAKLELPDAEKDPGADIPAPAMGQRRL